jgi:hypothetical protein
MQLGATMLHVDWLDGRTLGDWQFGVKLLCGRFPQMELQLLMCAVGVILLCKNIRNVPRK